MAPFRQSLCAARPSAFRRCCCCCSAFVGKKQAVAAPETAAEARRARRQCFPKKTTRHARRHKALQVKCRHTKQTRGRHRHHVEDNDITIEPTLDATAAGGSRRRREGTKTRSRCPVLPVRFCHFSGIQEGFHRMIINYYFGILRRRRNERVSEQGTNVQVRPPPVPSPPLPPPGTKAQGTTMPCLFSLPPAAKLHQGRPSPFFP